MDPMSWTEAMTACMDSCGCANKRSAAATTSADVQPKVCETAQPDVSTSATAAESKTVLGSHDDDDDDDDDASANEDDEDSFSVSFQEPAVLATAAVDESSCCGIQAIKSRGSKDILLSFWCEMCKASCSLLLLLLSFVIVRRDNVSLIKVGAVERGCFGASSSTGARFLVLP